MSTRKHPRQNRKNPKAKSPRTKQGQTIGPQEEAPKDWTPNPGAEDIIREQRGRHGSPGIENPIMPDPERSL